MLKIDKKTLRKAFFNNLDENIVLNYEAKVVFHINSLFQRVCERFREDKSLSEFIKSKEEFLKPVEINLGWDNVTQKFDSIQYVSIISTLKILLKHEDVLASILHQNNQEKDDRLRTYRDGKVFHRNRLLSSKQNSLQLILCHDDFETVNPLGNKVVKYKVSAFYFVLENILAKYRSRLNNINLLLLAPSALVQKYGYKEMLKPVLDDILTLENTGIEIKLDGQEHTFLLTVSMVVADNLAAHALGRFYCTFSTVARFCQFCNCTRDH